METPKLIRRSAKGRKKYLLPFGDVHLGAPTCNLEKAKKYIQWAVENDAWVLGMGDLIENASRHSVGAGVYEQTITPDEQIDAAVELLKPLTKKKQLLGLLHGNHEWRTDKEVAINPTKQIARSLGVPFLGYTIFLYLRVGEITYTVYALHGSSSSTKPSGKVGALFDLSRGVNADLYLMGHVHDLFTGADVVRYVDMASKTAKEKKRYYALTGSYLDFFDGYGEQKGYTMVKIGSPRVRLDGTKFDIHLSI